MKLLAPLCARQKTLDSCNGYLQASSLPLIPDNETLQWKVPIQLLALVRMPHGSSWYMLQCAYRYETLLLGMPHTANASGTCLTCHISNANTHHSKTMPTHTYVCTHPLGMWLATQLTFIVWLKCEGSYAPYREDLMTQTTCRSHPWMLWDVMTRLPLTLLTDIELDTLCFTP